MSFVCLYRKEGEQLFCPQKLHAKKYVVKQVQSKREYRSLDNFPVPNFMGIRPAVLQLLHVHERVA
jgi:hypothetical protein